MTNESERAKFEAWVRRETNFDLERAHNGEYVFAGANDSWVAWLARAKSTDPVVPVSELEAAHMIMSIWHQFGSNNDGELVHNFMGAPEDAGEWLEDLGLVIDDGYVFKPTEAGKALLDVDDRRSVKHFEHEIRGLIAKHTGRG